MKTLKQTLLGRTIPSIFVIIFLLQIGCATRQELVINSVEEIIVYTHKGTVRVLAKIDTGAESSSVDKKFVKRYGFDPHINETENNACPGGRFLVESANGDQCRERVELSFTLKNNFHSSPASVSDRSHSRYKILVGNRDTSGTYLVRPLIDTGIQDLSDEDEAEEEKKD